MHKLIPVLYTISVITSLWFVIRFSIAWREESKEDNEHNDEHYAGELEI